MTNVGGILTKKQIISIYDASCGCVKTLRIGDTIVDVKPDASDVSSIIDKLNNCIDITTTRSIGQELLTQHNRIHSTLNQPERAVSTGIAITKVATAKTSVKIEKAINIYSINELAAMSEQYPIIVVFHRTPNDVCPQRFRVNNRVDHMRAICKLAVYTEKYERVMTGRYGGRPILINGHTVKYAENLKLSERVHHVVAKPAVILTTLYDSIPADPMNVWFNTATALSCVKHRYCKTTMLVNLTVGCGYGVLECKKASDGKTELFRFIQYPKDVDY